MCVSCIDYIEFKMSGSFIQGVKDGKPCLYHLDTGKMTRPSESSRQKTNEKKRRRCPGGDKTFRELLNSVATESATSWVVGQKDGRVIYFNKVTKETRFTKPEALKNDTAFSEDVPTAMLVTESTEPIPLDADMDVVKMEEVDDEDIIKFLAFDPSIPQATETTANIQRTGSSNMSKKQLMRERNKQNQQMSRMRKAQKMQMLESKVVELEAIVEKLKKDVAVKSAENGVLKNQVHFLQEMVAKAFEKMNPPKTGVGNSSRG